MNRKMGVLAACAALVLLTGCVSRLVVSQLNLDVKVEKPFVIQKTPYQMKWGYCTFPYIAEFKGGGVVVAYNLAGEANYIAEYAESLREGGPAVTMDGGKTWIVGPQALNEAGCKVGRNYMGTVTSRGATLAIDNKTNGGGGNLHKLKFDIFRDGNWATTGYAATVECPTTVMPVYPSTRGVETPEGELLLAAWTKYATDTHVRTVLLASTNHGTSWFVKSTVATIDDCRWGLEGPCEPAFCRSKNGDLLMVIRTGGGGESGTSVGTSMLSARSSDGGKTWKHRRLSFPGVMPKLVPMSNGMLALAYGRPGNNLRLSRDDGASWGGEISFTGYNKQTTGYCDILEVAPGKLLAVYDLMNHVEGSFWLWEPPPALNYIFGVFVNVK